MRTGIRPWVAILTLALIAVSIVGFLTRRPSTWERANRRTSTPPRTVAELEEHSHTPWWDGGVTAGCKASCTAPSGILKRQPAESISRTRVLLENGRIEPVRPGRDSLGDPGVLAELYDGAPEEAVERLRYVLASGSNEYADFTRSEQYPAWVYEKMQEAVSGDLGRVLAWFAQRETALDPDVRSAPVLDWGEGYSQMRIGTVGEVPVAETKYGTVWVDRHYNMLTPVDFAVWLAHRLAAGDENLRLPQLPPKGYKDWESWVRMHLTEERARMLEGIGLLPRRG